MIYLVYSVDIFQFFGKTNSRPSTQILVRVNLYQRRFKMVRSIGASFQNVTGIWPLNI